jgi:tripartite-type tricarboxylate transporter receptor subunit TctC
MAALPDVPTVQQSGVAGYSVASWNAIAAPVGTSPEVVGALNRAVRDAVAESGVRDKLGKLGVRLQAGSPTELRSLLAGEIRRWGDVIRAARIEPE